MIVGTTEAANILKISTTRLRVLLIAGRVEGAYKTGKIWLMPLFNGRPIIKRGTRGPAPRWRNPRTPAKTMIHVNSHKIKQNQKSQIKQPVITVKKWGELASQTPFFPDTQQPTPSSGSSKKGNLNIYGHEVEILGGCRVVYRPDACGCGAKVWIETLNPVKVTRWDQESCVCL